MRIAKIRDLYLEIPDVRYSFFTTPYTPHKLGTAVDVYFEDHALFPFEEGKLIDVRKIRTPRHIPVREDYLMIFSIGDICLKVLHVDSSVKVGEKVFLGDEIGRLRLSGFFSPWTDKHAHFELRPCDDPYRARGGLIIYPILTELVKTVKGEEFEVVERKESYYMLKPLKKGKRGMTPFGNVEGGVPHYRYGAILNGREGHILGFTVKPDEILPNGVGLFRANFSVLANGVPVRGISFYCNDELVKLIGGEFEVGEIVRLRLD
ncbi:hypothetical protein [Pyrococcus abyssi]|uniref:Peptidase M23 domain-containing protein n=1 Tax=Pyrococcus abyssi (strain GE5 / Orsay) TaxID=272844 RepID=Q9UZD8_PYRAB|nr:hypothetical protein [Pyrococcus abyssi]CAB50121.1 Hypothetical protein PAB1581 [Pyrococcus abyssi GE5]CCE70646.1 TPA: hypothetical protein PAB1581 [Pyrococcus abyssi GE5]